jgi:hypothetical protein
MIERYFITGLRLKWAFPGADAGAPKDGTVIMNPNRAAGPMVYDGMDGELYDVMAPHVSTLGLSKGMAIPYSWLTYVLGRTSKKLLAGGDVLTGFMSGCLIAAWTENGCRYVGHVGTVEENEQANQRVKQTFAAYMPRDTTGFFPLAAWDAGSEIVPKARKFKAGVTPKILALVNTRGEFYSILLFMLGLNNEWCVGGIKKVPPLNYLTLKQQLDPRSPILGGHRG